MQEGGFIIMMRGLWYKVPAELFNDSYITKADMAVFAYVADRIKGETKAVSLQSIQAATELSRRQIQLSLHKLVECKYMQAVERPGKATLYKQLLLPIKKGAGDYEHPMESELQEKIKNVHIIAG